MPTALRCPTCSHDMDTGSHGGVPGHHCAACERFWFDASQLPRALRQPSAPARVDLLPPPDSAVVRPCPRCGVELTERFLTSDQALELLLCTRCSGASVTRADLAVAEERSREVQRENRDRMRRTMRLRRDLRSVPSNPTSASSGGALFVKSTSPWLWLFDAPRLEAGNASLKPVATWSMMGALLFLWFVQCFDPSGLEASIDRFGMVPAQVAQGSRWWTVITSVVVHASWLHVLGNLYFLFVFGIVAEAPLGAVGLVALFLVAGVTGNLLTLLEWSRRTEPGVGASGGIAGIMGAAAILAPTRRIYVPVFRWFFTTWLIVLPAWVFLGLWGFGNLLLGTMASSSMINYWSHAGGFLVGIIVVGSLRWAGVLAGAEADATPTARSRSPRREAGIPARRSSQSRT